MSDQSQPIPTPGSAFVHATEFRTALQPFIAEIKRRVAEEARV